MFLKFICCDVFTRIACDLVAKSPNIIDLEFVPMLAHVEPDNLRMLIEEKISNTTNNQTGRRYDAIILGFGLCGNAIIGLSSPIPMIIPRAHDCCTIFMGSKERFMQEFNNSFSARWSTTGYFERTGARMSDYSYSDQMENYKTSREYMSYLEKYDEETAEYLWETLHPKIESHESIYINIDGYEYSDSYEKYKAAMERLGVELRTVEGSISLLKALVDGDWDEDRFLTVDPGKKVAGIYDLNYVIEAV
ncbi:MAG: DUF1638 domain-containing protein [Oscillospiraceae bacterium]|nr:DUF1638 domain-containing protein [Oscillospiraceae bacterium]